MYLPHGRIQGTSQVEGLDLYGLPEHLRIDGVS